MAAVIPFPNAHRAPSPDRNPIYWQGIEDYLTTDVAARYGCTREVARRFARSTIAEVLGAYPVDRAMHRAAVEAGYAHLADYVGQQAPDGYPLWFGEGELS